MIPNTNFPIKSNQIRNDECAVLVIFRYFSIFQKITSLTFNMSWSTLGFGTSAVKNEKAIPDRGLGPRRQSGTEEWMTMALLFFPYLKWWAFGKFRVEHYKQNCWVSVGNLWVFVSRLGPWKNHWNFSLCNRLLWSGSFWRVHLV